MAPHRSSVWRRRIGAGLLNLLLLVLAAGMSWLVFLVLPWIEQATRPARGDLTVRAIDAVDLPPPPPAPPEPEKDPEPEEPPPDLAEPAAPLNLDQLELVLNPSFGEGAGDFVMTLPGMDGGAVQEEADAIFSAADLDQMPRAVSQSPPVYPPELRRMKISGTVVVVFMVDRNGKVVHPSVEQAPHPKLGESAQEAVRKWRFEPGRRKGAPVPFKMRIPITFLPP
ncbi:MAG: energy transducer TonB [Kiritimatiellia bacterium]|nr:energy transducer TonB [Kiritimatiellia bacterium]